MVNQLAAIILRIQRRFPRVALDASKHPAEQDYATIYVGEQYETKIDHLTRIVRPGGHLFITHKTPIFYLARALTMKHFADLGHVAKHCGCRLRKGMHRITTIGKHAARSRRPTSRAKWTCYPCALSGYAAGSGMNP